MYLRKCRKKGTDHPKVPVVWVTILVFEHFWVVSPFFTPVSLFIRYPARQLLFLTFFSISFGTLLVQLRLGAFFLQFIRLGAYLRSACFEG